MRKSLIAVLFLGLLLILGLFRAADLRASHDEVIARTHQRASSDALVLAEYLNGAFDAADAALRQVALQSRRIGGPSAPHAEWAPILEAARAGLTAVGAISVVDRDLVIRQSTRDDIVGHSRADDPYIARALTSGHAELIVGQPFRSPVVGEYLIPIGRRLLSSAGETDGAVIASFLPQDLRRFFQTVNIGQRGAVWVFHTSGSIVFSEPSPDDRIGERAADNALFAASAGGAMQGVREGPVIAGGPEMISGWRHVAGLPLVVGVSLDRDEMLGPWRREVRGFVLTYGAATVLVVGAMLLLFRQSDAKTRAERALQEAKAIEEARLRESNQGLALLLEREQAARRAAEEASALKDQFVMTVSHELRTPLTAIAGWARMLVDGLVPEDKRETALQTIERNAQAQRRLIEDLLDISGIMTGKLRLDVRPIAADEVVRNAVDAILPAADAKGIRLETTVDPAVGPIAADPERLQQIVWNLLSNAVKFTPNGGRVTLHLLREQGGVRITVADTGEGISPELLPFVFERFRQGAGGHSRRHGGLGLGLAIVRSLVELHGGTVTAASDGPGRGAAFTVVLPAAPHRVIG